MDWFEPMDEYCERLGPGFWAEPFNAVSNAAFIIAAAALFVRWQNLKHRDVLGLLLILNVGLVGVGSFLYHTFANRWSELADIIPISAFILFYLLVGLQAFLGLRWWQSLLIVLLFMAASQVITGWLVPIIGYTATYLPALAAIFTVGLAVRPRGKDVANRLFGAGLVFTASVTFRAVDLPLCGWMPYGTHMFWHLLNATMLFLLVNLYLGCVRTMSGEMFDLR